MPLHGSPDLDGHMLAWKLREGQAFQAKHGPSDQETQSHSLAARPMYERNGLAGENDFVSLGHQSGPGLGLRP